MLYCSYRTHIFPHYTDLPTFQGNRILSGGHFTKESSLHPALPPLGFDATRGCPFLLEQIERHMPYWPPVTALAIPWPAFAPPSVKHNGSMQSERPTRILCPGRYPYCRTWLDNWRSHWACWPFPRGNYPPQYSL